METDDGNLEVNFGLDEHRRVSDWRCLLDIQGSANWSEIRELIAHCDELPEGIRTQMVALGDGSLTGGVCD